MKLTLQTDYALRMLIFVAINDDRPVTVSDVAAAYGLSRHHLLKVALKLGRLGYVRTTRGRFGGISLGRAPQEINVGAVVRAMEDDFALVECLGAQGGSCVITPACRLRGMVGEAVQAFLGVFDAYTVADLVANRSFLRDLLEPPGNPYKAA